MVAPEALAWVAVSDLVVGSSFREGGLSGEHVERLVGLRGSWPPILVSPDGAVIDGAHRVAAARRLGMARVEAVLFEGGPEEAFVEFVRRNVAHGLLLTLAERKRAAVRVLRAHPAWSDRRVAALCGVSSKTVARVRVEAGVCPTGDGASIDGGMRVGRDGRCRPVRRGSVRARVLEALRADPSASLRAIASVAEVSPETVRLVRMNMAEVEASSGDEPAAAASWRDDAALVSCEEGEEFVGWFERTLVGVEDLARAGAVPLSRVYEVGDEARRRSEAWLEFARALEARTTRTR